MLTWFSANLINIAVVGIVLVLLALAVRKIVFDRLHHRSYCITGVCSGDFAHCHM